MVDFEDKSGSSVDVLLTSGKEAIVMGILNCTPDSFYSGSRVKNVEETLINAEKMVLDGATIMDVGAYSTRPGAAIVELEEEWQRLADILTLLVTNFPKVQISIDTFRSEIAKRAVDCGVRMINDVSGGNADAKMFGLVSELNVPYVLMHSRGTPETMTGLNQYDDLVADVKHELMVKIKTLNDLGFEKILVDVGFGFAKNVEQNFELLKRLDEFRDLGYPVLAGISRKSMIYKSLGIAVEESLNGTTVLNSIALMKGAKILRVHDVKEAVEAIKLVRNVLG